MFAGRGAPSRTFTYGVPDGVTIATGHLVRVPLGSRAAAGVVVETGVPLPSLRSSPRSEGPLPLRPLPLGALKDVEGLVLDVPVLLPHQLELARWIAERYRCALGDAIRAMVPPALHRGRVPRGRGGKRRIPAEFGLEHDPGARDATPTSGQAAALDAIVASLGSGSAFLLHGVTGSGKTEVYLRAIGEALARGLGAIVLVPEIVLTPQLVARVLARFADRVALLHSSLSVGERLDEWRRVLAGEVDVVVGSRSALLAPLRRIGIVVVDEEQEPSYKQESDPRYHAVDTALALGRIAGATVVLGSATPRVTTYHAARRGELRLLELPVRIGGQPLPPTTVVDLRLELRAGNRGTLSQLLRTALERAAAKGEQAILYLNRRGFATVVLCRDCGYVASCPSCEIPYALHRIGGPGSSGSRSPNSARPGAGPPATPGRTEGSSDAGGPRLLCHRCGRVEVVPTACPRCGSERIRHLGVGTQRVEAEIRAAVPHARVVRLDRDAVRRKGAHAAAYELMRSGRAQVIVGTQMVAKGFDLPGVTLVGVVNADTLLNLPDHGAAERTFQLVTQVLGRSGRGPAGGRGIVQTYLPEHYAIRAAAAHDYATFADAELLARRRFGFPPFARLVLLQTAARRLETVERRATELARELRASAGDDAAVLGPAPAFAAKRAGSHQAQIVLRGPHPERVLDRVEVGAAWSVDVDPVSLLG